MPFEEGFGSGFVRRIIEHELRGRSSFEFDPTGLRCTIEFPLRRNVQQEGPVTEKE